MNKELVTMLGQQMVDAVKGYVTRNTSSLEARIKALEDSQIVYRGVWEESGGAYHEHDFVTHGGCLWYCQAPDTRDRPGASDAWRLMQKNSR